MGLFNRSNDRPPVATEPPPRKQEPPHEPEPPQEPEGSVPSVPEEDEAEAA